MAKAVKISVRAYAKMLNVDEKSIRKAIIDGKFVHGYDKVDKKINPSKAEKNSWVQEQKIIKPKAGVSVEKAIKKLETVQENGKNEDKNLPEPDQNSENSLNEDEESLIENLKIYKEMDVSEAMRIRQVIGAALDKKQLQEKEGVLVKRADVEKALFAAGNQLKKEVMSFPEKIIDDVRACPNKVDALNIMKHQLNLVLSRFSSGIAFNNIKSD